jgi:hypothetical protein
MLKEMNMKTVQREFGFTRFFKLVLVLTAIWLLPATVNGQWTTSGNNIYNTNTGKVGVGNDLPNYRLDVATQTTGDESQIRFGLGGGNSGGFLYSGNASHATFAGGASFNTGGWTARSLSASIIEANLGTLKFYTNNGISNGNPFTPAARMIIDAGGNLGLGTTSPAYRMDVSGTGTYVARFKKTDNSNGGIVIDSVTGFNPNVSLAVNGTTKWYLLNNATGSDSLQFWETSGSFPRFTLTQAGTVGIGTGTPNASYKLDVQGGTINSSGGLCIAGVCKTDWSQVGGSQWANGSGSTIFYNSGNVGIGTASAPTRKLEVLGGNVFHQWSTSAGSEYGFYTAINNNHLASNLYFDGAWKMIATGKGAFMATAPNGGNAFALLADNTSRAANAVASFSQLLVVTMDGKVGVSTGTPTYSLDVNGGVNSFRAKAATASSGDTIATFENNSAIQMIVRGNGNVGIGTTSPTEKFHVEGNAKVTGTLEGGNIKAKYQDVAEWVDSSQELEAGTVVVLDTAKSNQVVASTQAYDSRVAGVISVQPGIALGEQGEGRVLVATTGRVKIKVDASNGPINIGDLLVTSEKTGLAMKSMPVDIGGVRLHRPGTLIGKALEPLTQGTGEILVLLSLQ